MDKKYLEKVLNRIIGETEFDNMYNVTKPVMFSIKYYIVKDSPFFVPEKTNLPIWQQPLPAAFVEHCQNIYGLNKEETEYVWGVYKKFIISNG